MIDEGPPQSALVRLLFAPAPTVRPAVVTKKPVAPRVETKSSESSATWRASVRSAREALRRDEANVAALRAQVEATRQVLQSRREAHAAAMTARRREMERSAAREHARAKKEALTRPSLKKRRAELEDLTARAAALQEEHARTEARDKLNEQRLAARLKGDAAKLHELRLLRDLHAKDGRSSALRQSRTRTIVDLCA